jgi:hypothetical protein
MTEPAGLFNRRECARMSYFGYGDLPEAGAATCRHWRGTPVHRPLRFAWLAIVPAGWTMRARDLPPATPCPRPKVDFHDRRNWAFMVNDRVNNLLLQSTRS